MSRFCTVVNFMDGRVQLAVTNICRGVLMLIMLTLSPNRVRISFWRIGIMAWVAP